MVDIVIDEDYLSTTATELETLASDLTEMCGQMRGLDGLVVGAAPVFDELHEFAGAWSGCAEELAEYAEGGATYVRAILEAFAELDLQMAEMFTERELESH